MDAFTLAEKLKRKITVARQMPPHERLRLSRARIRQAARGVVLSAVKSRVSAAFHSAHYHSEDTWKRNAWFGFPVQQIPSDLHLYQEIIASSPPDFIIQTGVYDGGSALFLAHMLDLAQAPPSALVIAIDIVLRPSAHRLSHPRIRLIEGSSTAPETLAQVEALIADIPPVRGGMVSLDSDHRARHVAAELAIYPRFVGVGNYLVVEDTNINGHPVLPEFGLGPFEALQHFLARRDDFEPDDALWQPQTISFHAGGWLKRTR